MSIEIAAPSEKRAVALSPETEVSQRAAVVAEARKWVGTPYAPAQDVRGAGVDCGMLLVRAFVDAGLVVPFDPRPYPPDWHLHRSEEKYLGFVGDLCAPVASPQPGDVAVFKYGRTFSHGGIIVAAKPLTLIHAYLPARMVIEEHLAANAVLTDPKHQARYYSFWATNDGAVA